MDRSNLKNETPVTIDTELARVETALFPLYAPFAARKEALAKIRKYERMNYPIADYQREAVTKTERRCRIAGMIIDRIRRELVKPLQDEYLRRRWNRFYVVPGGHIHLDSRNCHTLRPTTYLGWLPEDSGNGENETIVKHGETACTHCFPDAPTLERKTGAIVDGKCTGKSYTPRDGDRSGARWAYRYGYCDHCGTYASITTANNLRKHKVNAK